MSGRQYEGPALDGTVQPISEAPYWQGDGETVDVVDDTETGQKTTEDVPVPDPDERPDREGQITIDDRGWSA